MPTDSPPAPTEQVAALVDRPDVHHVVDEWDIDSQQFADLEDGWVAAGAVVRNSDGEVAFVDPSWADQWVLPGGSVEAGETLAEAAARELREETGLTVDLGDHREHCVLRRPRRRRRRVTRVAWFDGAPPDTPAFVDPEEMLGDCRPDAGDQQYGSQ